MKTKQELCIELIQDVKARAPEAFTADDIFTYASNEHDLYKKYGSDQGGLSYETEACLFNTLEHMIGNDYDPIDGWSDDYDEAIEKHAKDSKKDLMKEERKLGLFDTPYPIALAMSDMADLHRGDHVLDPSAGRGRLLEYALRKEGVTAEGIELVGRQEISSIGKRDVVFREDLNIRQGNFMEMDPEFAPDVVLMNPPFGNAVKDLGEPSGERALIHFYRAFHQLKQGGRMVALLPVGPFEGSKSQFVEFRDRLSKREVIIQINLGGGLFKETPIPTKIIVVDNVPQTGRAKYKAYPVVTVTDPAELYSATALCCRRKR